MKRSKMVHLMMAYSAERYGNGPLSYMDDMEFHDYLLTKMEEQGVLPPLTKLSHLGMMDNGWDAEDSMAEEELEALVLKSQASFGLPESLHIVDPDTGDYVFVDTKNPSDEAVEVLTKLGVAGSKE